eukprot:6467481-Amphidinium_carterae.1
MPLPVHDHSQECRFEKQKNSSFLLISHDMRDRGLLKRRTLDPVYTGYWTMLISRTAFEMGLRRSTKSYVQRNVQSADIEER